MNTMKRRPRAGKRRVERVAGPAPAVSLIPLGGTREIGKNMTAVEYGDDIVVIDAGVAFPDEELLGIDLVVPDISYLLENADRVRAIVLTHGHEDHIGALPYILPRLNVPVYGTKLTIGLVNKKLEEHRLQKQARLHVVVPGGSPVRLGQISVEWIRTNHSIPDGCALALHTPAGVIVHSGDFKIDPTPIDGRHTDIARLSALGEEGVLALFCDATNAERPGYTPSEKVVGETFERVFEQAEGRILIATFASNIHRIQQAVDTAARTGRKVAIAGRSMRENVAVAEELGYLHVPKGTLVELEEVNRLPDDKVVILTTGSQGEPMAALTRMANNDHRQVQIRQGDTVIISATPIPGNESLVGRTIDNLFRLGAEVIYKEVAQVHVSGHASQEEIKFMANMVRPRYLIPFHGEYRHLAAFIKIAEELGIGRDRVLIPDIGDRVEISREKGAITGHVNSGSVFIDGLGIGDVGHIVLRDRLSLATNGVLVVVVVMDKQKGRFLSGPDIITRGFVYVRESEALLESAKRQVQGVLKEIEDKGITEWSVIKAKIQETLAAYLDAVTGRRPNILPIIIEI
ncbi:MAG: ribonuclease [Bacillota bacterium]|nr:ribonuclease [Bacillota bacterium]